MAVDVLRVDGEGELVLAVTDALLGPGDDGEGDGAFLSAGCYDLWRVAEGRIVEHWAVVRLVPENLLLGNGSF